MVLIMLGVHSTQHTRIQHIVTDVAPLHYPVDTYLLLLRLLWRWRERHHLCVRLRHRRHHLRLRRRHHHRLAVGTWRQRRHGPNDRRGATNPRRSPTDTRL